MNSEHSTAKKINVSSTLTESWQLVSGLKLPVFLIDVIAPFCFVIVFFFIGYTLLSTFLPDVIAGPIFLIVSFLFMWLTVVVYTMLGVRRALGLPATIMASVNQCGQTFIKVMLLSLGWLIVMAAFFALGEHNVHKNDDALVFVAFLIVYIMSAPFFIFTVPLVVHNRFSILQALKQSYVMMFRNFIPIAACYILMLMILFISMIPFGIGLIWTQPMFTALGGVLFRDLFAVSLKQEK